MTASDFQFVVKLLRDASGVALELGKEYLVDARLTPLAKRHSLTTVAQYIQLLRGKRQSELLPELVEAMVTTETSFFRDGQPFEVLRTTVLPQFIESRKTTRDISIWCAASSCGQEPYSIAMLLREHFPELLGWDVTILATDISQEMLQRCRDARYSQLELSRGITANYMKYFTADGSHWKLDESIRNMVQWRHLNLAGTWAIPGTFDLIFLRNVMIYFETNTKKTILQRVRQRLRPNGYLVLGAAETPFGLDDSFERVESLKSGYYQCKP